MIRPVSPSDISTFEQELRQRREIPLYSGVEKFEQLRSDIAAVSEHPVVAERISQFSRLLSPAAPSTDGTSSAALLLAEPQRRQHLDAFIGAVAEGLRKSDTVLNPETILGANGVRLDAARSLKTDDLRGEVLRAGVRTALEQIFLDPRSSEADTLLADKIIALSRSGKGEKRELILAAVTGAFADVMTLPHLSEPFVLSGPQQHLLMQFLGGGGARFSRENPPILELAVERGFNAVMECRSAMIKGNTAGLLPQQMNDVPLSSFERHALSLIESLSRLQQILDPHASGAIDLSSFSFREAADSAWIASFTSPKITAEIRGLLAQKFTEDVAHRTYNLGMEPLKYLGGALEAAFEREHLPRTVWPPDGFARTGASKPR